MVWGRLSCEFSAQCLPRLSPEARADLREVCAEPSCLVPAALRHLAHREDRRRRKLVAMSVRKRTQLSYCEVSVLLATEDVLDHDEPLEDSSTRRRVEIREELECVAESLALQAHAVIFGRVGLARNPVGALTQATDSLFDEFWGYVEG